MAYPVLKQYIELHSQLRSKVFSILKVQLTYVIKSEMELSSLVGNPKRCDGVIMDGDNEIMGKACGNRRER